MADTDGSTGNITEDLDCHSEGFLLHLVGAGELWSDTIKPAFYYSHIQAGLEKHGVGERTVEVTMGILSFAQEKGKEKLN
jgi:hypothetical protein